LRYSLEVDHRLELQLWDTITPISITLEHGMRPCVLWNAEVTIAISVVIVEAASGSMVHMRVLLAKPWLSTNSCYSDNTIVNAMVKYLERTSSAVDAQRTRQLAVPVVGVKRDIAETE
jgi:hypothetical protein